MKPDLPTPHFSFFAPGLPIGQPRVRACRRGRHVGVYDPGTAAYWKGVIIAAARAAYSAPPLTGPVQVDVLFRFPRPQAHIHAGKLKAWAPTYHTAKPDRDNLDKAVLDAIVAAGILSDDAIVAAGTLVKQYADPAESPGAYVTIGGLTR